jgi:WD40 repeat protein
MNARWVVAATLVIALCEIGTIPSAASTNTGGTQRWEARYNGPNAKEDDPRSVTVSPDGSRVFVTGSSDATGAHYDIATIAYDASTGTALWTTRYNDITNGDDYAARSVISPDGATLFVAGSGSTATGDEMVTLAYDTSTGVAQWTAGYGPTGFAGAGSLALSPDGSTVFVTGASGSLGLEDFATVAYDASTGIERWATGYDGPGHAYDAASAVRVSADGSKVFVTGPSTGATSREDFATVAYDSASGDRLWARRFSGKGDSADIAIGLASSPDGAEMFVTGYSVGASNTDTVTLAYDPTSGALLWRRRYDGAAHGTDGPISLAVAPDGSTLYLTGYSASAGGDLDYATVAYAAATGSTIWAKRYAGPGGGDDFPAAVSVSPNGSNVFVTGTALQTPTSADFTTIAYEASTGQFMWGAQYARPVARAESLAVSPDGSRVFICGQIHGMGGIHDYDYATVAYEA